MFLVEGKELNGITGAEWERRPGKQYAKSAPPASDMTARGRTAPLPRFGGFCQQVGIDGFPEGAWNPRSEAQFLALRMVIP